MKTNDLNIYPIGPTPTTPPAGGVFMDPTFNTPILRVTDATDGPGFVTEYGAIWDCFNSDSSYLYYENLSGGRFIAALDFANKKILSKKAIDKNIAVQYWSRLNPHVLYAVENWQAAKIWKLDVSTWTWSLVVDLTTVAAIVQTPNSAWVGSRGMSWDDNRIMISGTFGGVYGVGVYDITLGKMIGPVTINQLQTALPNAAQYGYGKSDLDASGKYCMAITGGTLNGQTSNSAQVLFNIETGAVYPVMIGYPPNSSYNDVHTDFGPNGLMCGVSGMQPSAQHVDDGFYPLVAGPVDPNNLSTYETKRRAVGPRVPWGIDSHTSFRDAAGQWALFTFDGAQQATDKIISPFQPGEIFELGINSPGDGSVNRRICQAYSNPAAVGQSYYGVPFASQSQDNRCVGFHSTYGNSRLDIYIAFLDVPAPPVAPTGQLAGVMFTQDEAAILQQFALSQLSLKKG